MNNQLTLLQLCNAVENEFYRLEYKKLTIQEYKRQCKKIIQYAETKGVKYFTEEFGEQFLKDCYNYSSEMSNISYTSSTYSAIRAVRRLGEFQLFGVFTRFRIPNNSIDWHLDDIDIIDAYTKSVQTIDNSEATKKLRIHHIKLFYNFLKFSHIKSVLDVDAKIISKYVLSMQGDSPVYVKHKLATLRYYFKFLYNKELISKDLSEDIPRLNPPKNVNLPALWTDEEIKTLINSIDRGNPAGKRDYAAIVLVTELGIRISDVAQLKLSDFNWEQKELTFAQHKTQNIVTYPLTDDIGWAIIDYIRYARPKTEIPYVFLSINAPYENLSPGGIGSILDRAMQRAGIKKNRGVVSGMHSLRHALARKLLSDGVELELIADIMGHKSPQSSKPYLKVDIDNLRECALSLEVNAYERV